MYLVVRKRGDQNLDSVFIFGHQVLQVGDGFRLKEDSGANLEQDANAGTHLQQKRVMLGFMAMKPFVDNPQGEIFTMSSLF